jgi:SNF2 family DNA or RNA helicase
MRLHAILTSIGSHPATAAATLQPLAERDDRARQLCERAGRISRSAKDEKLLHLLKESHEHKVLIFVASIRTLHRLQSLLTEAAISFSTFSGEQSSTDKDAAVAQLKSSVNVMLCTESGGEGRNLQFADTLINFDLPWNPMKIEQRIGRIHRFGQTQDVFIFNLCTAGTLESRILKLLNDKIRMFELVVGEVGSILGNLDDGQEFESLVLQLWQKAPDDKQLDADFETLGDTLVAAQEKYLDAKNLDEALFGEDYE